ncbi:MAG TPA: HAMP domain-containing sensor histidine kinase, partial [Longimicrobiales bacterium]
QRDTLEETAAETEMLNEQLLERTQAEEAAHAATEAERRRLAQLHELTAALSAASTPADVAHVAGHWGRTVMGAATALVVVPTEDGSALEPVDATGLPEDFLTRWSRIPCDVPALIVEAACRGRTVQAPSAAARRECFPALELHEGLEAALAAPLLLEGRRLGAWAIYFLEPRDFSAAEVLLFEAVTEQLAQAMERARLFQAERRARAEAERANSSKVNFLSIMSHDVRTPLNAILGYAELLHGGYMGQLQEKQQEFVGRILASTSVLRALVEEVLEYARIEAGRLEIRTAELRVGPLLERVETIVAPQAEAKGIALLRQEPPPVLVQGDADRIGQILSNLVTNAIKYTQAGGAVTVGTTADEGGVEFHVGDNGPGIEPADLDRIFEPFVQLEHARESEVGGVGLGLAISRELARAMGGELRAESRPGQTTFTLRLPRGHDDAPPDGLRLSA